MKIKELIEVLNQVENKDREVVLEIYSDLYDTFYKGNLQTVQLINHRAELCGNVIMMTDYNDYLEQFDPPAQGEDYSLCYKGRKEKDPDWLDVMFKSLFENGSFEDISD